MRGVHAHCGTGRLAVVVANVSGRPDPWTGLTTTAQQP
jgi:hypothetical protein